MDSFVGSVEARGALHFLRPATTLAELLQWAVASGVEGMDFVVDFKPELRLEFAAFLDDAEQVTFREMVEHYARRFQEVALQGSAT
jgi:hypothetical protein